MYGLKVEITHPDRTRAWYAHLSATEGAIVRAGDVNVRVGVTGNLVQVGVVRSQWAAQLWRRMECVCVDVVWAPRTAPEREVEMAVQSGQRTTQVPVDTQAKRYTTSETGAERSIPEFVGRDDALTAVVEALQQGPALVLIEGEPGIGKTRLLREALTAIKGHTSTHDPTSDTHSVLVAACPPLKDPFPLGAIVDGLRRLVRSNSELSIGELGLSALGGALRPLFPEWAEQLPPALEALGDPKETRHRLFRALTELVERLDVDVLVIEDVHWADTATLEWLLTLTAAEPVPDEAAPGEIGRSIVVSYRPTDVPEGSLLLRLTSRPPTGMNQVRVTLGPLDVEQTRRLVASMFRTDEVSEEFGAFLHERTDGVPLAVEECVRLLRDRKDIVRQPGHWSRRALENLDVPPTVRDSVLERVDRLHPDVRAVLHAAAVLAAPSDEQLLTTVAALDEQTGQLAVTAALASGLLQETAPRRFVFRHVLDSQAVAESIQPSDWRRLHATAAEELRDVEPEPVVRLARHYREAGETEAWCHYAEASADLALESGDDYAAVTILLNLLATVEHPLERQARLARNLGEAAAFGAAALPEVAGRVVEALRVVLDGDVATPEKGEIRLLLARLLFQLGVFEDGRAELEIAVPELTNQPASAAQAMIMLASPELQRRSAATSLDWLERATELFDTIESPLDRIVFTVDRAMILLDLGMEEGWQAFEAVPRSASTAAEQRQIVRSQVNVVGKEISWGRYAEARQRLTILADLVRASEFSRVTPFLTYNQILLDWYTANWEGLHAMAAGLAAAEEAPSHVRREAGAVRGLLDFVCGDHTGGERRLRGVMEQRAQLGGSGIPDGVTAALARLYVADGAIREALALTKAPMDVVARTDMWWQATDLAAVHSDVLTKAGRHDNADALVEQFARWVWDRAAPASAAALATCRAIVAEGRGDHGRAAALFADAAAAWAALPRPYDELLAFEQQGRCLFADGDTEQALAMLSDVQERLRALGAKWDADRVAHLLRQHGVEVPRVWRRGRRGYGDQLSPRELEVVGLVARGMTNKQVADALFVSPKTVAMQLSAAMRKLGVTSRTAVVMAAVEAGLLTPEAERSED